MRDVGVYFHIPFCERVCPYCDFAVVPRKVLSPQEEERYVAALLVELCARAGRFAGLPVATVYFGGGTPSLLHPESLATLLDAVTAQFDTSPGEVTLEVNPSTVERDRLPAFRGAGINRLSIGIQSFDDTVLRRLGRAHRGAECDETLRAARAAGFTNLSLDLIFGAPGQDETSLATDLERALAHAPEHISAYTLTVEGETPFARAAAQGKLPLPEEEEGLAMLERVWGTLSAAGYHHYELSNFARPGFAAAHNRRYWERAPVLALGVGACSFDPATVDAPHGSRPENPRALCAYYGILEGNPYAASEVTALSRDEAIREALFLALRTERGLDLRAFTREFGHHPRFCWGERVDALISAGLLEERPGRRWKLTPGGRRIADSVLLELL